MEKKGTKDCSVRNTAGHMRTSGSRLMILYQHQFKENDRMEGNADDAAIFRQYSELLPDCPISCKPHQDQLNHVCVGVCWSFSAWACMCVYPFRSVASQLSLISFVPVPAWIVSCMWLIYTFWGQVFLSLVLFSLLHCIRPCVHT